jgi:hypothetical protein
MDTNNISTQTLPTNGGDEQCVIAWERKENTSRSWDAPAFRLRGRGKKLMTRLEAEALAVELNAQYPHIEHQAVRA